MDIVHIATAMFGLVIGLLVWNRVARWLISIWEFVKSQRAGSTASSKVSILAVLFLHSGPWLLIAAIVFAYSVLSAPHRSEMDWFFGGTLGAPLVILLLVATVLLRARKAKVQKVEP